MKHQSFPNLSDKSLEIRFIVACSRLEMTLQLQDELRELLAQSLDWDYIISVSAKHGVIPFINRHIYYLEGVPESVKQIVVERSNKTVRKNMIAFTCLIDLTRLLEHYGIVAVPIKGPVLAHMLYGNISMRNFSDLDILIPESESDRVEGILRANGYVPVSSNNSLPQIHKGKKRHKDIGYISKRWGTYIEVHHRLTKLDAPVQLTYDHYKSRLSDISIGTATFKSLGSEDLFLYLCIHGTSHMWERLEWVLAIAEMIRQNKCDWSLVALQARKCHTVLSTSSAVALAQMLFPDIKVPSELENKRARARAVSDQALARLFVELSEYAHIRHVFTYRIQTRDSVWDQLRQFWYFVSDLKKEQVGVRPISFAALPVHYFMRSCRLVVKYVRSL